MTEVKITSSPKRSMSEYHGDVTPTEYLFKILVVGDVGCGKTSLIKRLVHNVFSNHYKATIGVDFALKVDSFSNVIVRSQLWDIAGQERFGNMTRVYYKEARAAIIVCDITRESTFDALERWKLDLDQKVRNFDDSPIPVIVFVNKRDLIDTEQQVTSNVPKKIIGLMPHFCLEHNIYSWHLTSAKEPNDEGLKSGFRGLISHLVEHDEKIYNAPDTITLEALPIDDINTSSSCC